MTVNTAWTNPATLDKAVGAIVPSADYNELQSDVNYLGGADGNTHGGVAPTAVTPLTVTTEWAIIHTAASPTVHLPTTPTNGRMIQVKHRGSGTMTLDVNGGGSTIWTTAAVASLSLGVGDAYTLLGDGTYWNVVG